MSTAKGIDAKTLERYLEARKVIGKHADRIVAVSHLLGLLKHCDDTIEVSPSAIAEVADMIDQDICSIIETLDEFIHVLDAEEALE